MTTAVKAAVGAVIEDTSLDLEAKLAKITDLLTMHDELTGDSRNGSTVEEQRRLSAVRRAMESKDFSLAEFYDPGRVVSRPVKPPRSATREPSIDLNSPDFSPALFYQT
jgi:hypothetical protein